MDRTTALFIIFSTVITLAFCCLPHNQNNNDNNSGNGWGNENNNNVKKPKTEHLDALFNKVHAIKGIIFHKNTTKGNSNNNDHKENDEHGGDGGEGWKKGVGDTGDYGVTHYYTHHLTDGHHFGYGTPYHGHHSYGHGHGHGVNSYHPGGGIKFATEEKNGLYAKGLYALRDPDGSWRYVSYNADQGGFHADVKHETYHRPGQNSYSHGHQTHQGAHGF